MRFGLPARVLLIVAVVSMLSAAALAEDSASATGTWTWTMQRPGGTGGGGSGGNVAPREVTLKLTQDGEALTGTISGFRNQQEIEIQDGTIKDGQISFKVVRKWQDREFTSTYSGTLEGDTITGTIETIRDGETRSRDWQAKRSTATTQPSGE